MSKRKTQRSTKVPGAKPVKILHFKLAASMGTPRPLLPATGPGTCFHDGNRVSLTKLTAEAGEVMGSTVAEIWPADRDMDLVDGALLAHTFNNFGFIFDSLQDCSTLLAEILDTPRKLTFKEIEMVRKARRMLRRADRVRMPLTTESWRKQ